MKFMKLILIKSVAVYCIKGMHFKVIMVRKLIEVITTVSDKEAIG